MRVLLDAHDPAVTHVDDCRPAAEEVRAATLQRPLVGRIELDPREAHADDHAVGEPDRAVDDDVVVLGGAIRDDLEDALATDDDRLRLAGRHPFHVRIQQRRHRVEVPVDERVVAAQQNLGALVAHGFESRGGYTGSVPGAHSSAGRASRWQREGRRFEPGWVHARWVLNRKSGGRPRGSC